jgi:hypothetical protein
MLLTLIVAAKADTPHAKPRKLAHARNRDEMFIG